MSLSVISGEKKSTILNLLHLSSVCQIPVQFVLEWREIGQCPVFNLHHFLYPNAAERRNEALQHDQCHAQQLLR